METCISRKHIFREWSLTIGGGGGGLVNCGGGLQFFGHPFGEG